jgi:hypothetical protein
VPRVGGGLISRLSCAKDAVTKPTEMQQKGWIRKVVTDFLLSKVISANKIASWREDWKGN